MLTQTEMFVVFMRIETIRYGLFIRIVTAVKKAKASAMLE